MAADDQPREPQAAVTGTGGGSGPEGSSRAERAGMPVRIQERAAQLKAAGGFLGGPFEDFERVGRLQLVTLVQQGLNPSSKVLDVGCGSLRAGYWLMNFLEPGGYHGIEPRPA